MEAEEDAAGAIIEEDQIHANGGDDGESQRHRPIISGEQTDNEAYAALYTGRTKITRLLFIADKCGVPSMHLEALRRAKTRSCSERLWGRLTDDWARIMDRIMLGLMSWTDGPN